MQYTPLTQILTAPIFLFDNPHCQLIIQPPFHQFCPLSLTALPVRVAELEVSAGAGGVLLGSLRAADVLDLVVEGLERGVHLCVVRAEVSRGLVGPHVPERIGALVSL